MVEMYCLGHELEYLPAKYLMPPHTRTDRIPSLSISRESSHLCPLMNLDDIYILAILHTLYYPGVVGFTREVHTGLNIVISSFDLELAAKPKAVFFPHSRESLTTLLNPQPLPTI